jgi:hypothetical protein
MLIQYTIKAEVYTGITMRDPGNNLSPNGAKRSLKTNKSYKILFAELFEDQKKHWLHRSA